MTAARIISRFIFPSRAFGAAVRAAWLPAVALALLSAAAVPGICAQSITMTGHAGAIVVADSRMSIEQAVRMAEQKFKARVVRAESQDEGGKTVYVLRMLNDSGRVWTVKVDAATGTVT